MAHSQKNRLGLVAKLAGNTPPQIAQWDYRECDHLARKKAGFSPDPFAESGQKQRYQCYSCGKKFCDRAPQEQRRIEWVRKILRAYLAGVSHRETARDLHIHRITVGRWYRRFRQRTDRAPCGCGRAAGHSGRCHFIRIGKVANMNLEDEYGIRHEWHFGTTETQRRRSVQVRKALIQAGVPNVQRQPRTWFNDPKTMVWGSFVS